MADICNKCGKMIVIPQNQYNFEKDNRKLVTLHRDCDADNWEDFEKKEFEIVQKLKDEEQN